MEGVLRGLCALGQAEPGRGRTLGDPPADVKASRAAPAGLGTHPRLLAPHCSSLITPGLSTPVRLSLLFLPYQAALTPAVQLNSPCMQSLPSPAQPSLSPVPVQHRLCGGHVEIIIFPLVLG